MVSRKQQQSILAAILFLFLFAWTPAVDAQRRRSRLFRRRCRVLRQEPAAASQSVVASQKPWRSLFDGESLKRWKVAQFGGEGEISVKDGAIVMGFGESLTGVTYTGEDLPKTDYEVRVEAKRVDGIDFFCCLTFPVADSYCSLVVGGWAGAVVGLSSIDGFDASENDTTKYMNFKMDRWYGVRVQVTKTHIRAWIDDEKVVDQNIEGRKITTRAEVDLSEPLGFTSWQTKAALRNIELRRLAP